MVSKKLGGIGSPSEVKAIQEVYKVPTQNNHIIDYNYENKQNKHPGHYFKFWIDVMQ